MGALCKWKKQRMPVGLVLDVDMVEADMVGVMTATMIMEKVAGKVGKAKSGSCRVIGIVVNAIVVS